MLRPPHALIGITALTLAAWWGPRAPEAPPQRPLADATDGQDPPDAALPASPAAFPAAAPHDADAVVPDDVEAVVDDTGPVEVRIRTTPLSFALAEAARHHVDVRPRGFRADCSGFVEAITHRAGVPLKGSVAMMQAALEAEGRIHHHPIPHIGDLAFFHNTYDRNRNGRQDDLWTHIAVVVDVEPDGTLVLAHHGSKRALIRMNLRPALQHRKTDADGRVVNSVLKYRYDAPLNWPLRLTSQNWAAFATL